MCCFAVSRASGGVTSISCNHGLCPVCQPSPLNCFIRSPCHHSRSQLRINSRTDPRGQQTWGMLDGIFSFSPLRMLPQVRKKTSASEALIVLFVLMFLIDCRWSSKTAQLAKKCPTPTVYPLTRLNPKYTARLRFDPGEKVYYDCAQDFTPSRGSRAVQCVHGKWTKLTLKCESKYVGFVFSGKFQRI